MKSLRGALRVVLFFCYSTTNIPPPRDLLQGDLRDLPEGDLRGDPGMMIEDLLHYLDCCLFMLLHHDDSIMDGEGDDTLRPEGFQDIS